MTDSQSQVLAMLAEQDVSPESIALVLGLDVATVWQILGELERDGLVVGTTVQ